ncbi:MAG: DUF2344 domain-containing protein, partial [Caldilineae bacterium]
MAVPAGAQSALAAARRGGRNHRPDAGGAREHETGTCAGGVKVQATPKYRYRLTFRKEFPVKYVAHLDMVKTWTRAFRRAGLPLAYSEGFNPQARIQVAASLPVGTMGAAELMDIYLTEPLDAADILRRVRHT